MEENSLEIVTVNGIIKERNIVVRDYYRENLEALDRELAGRLEREIEYKQKLKKEKDKVLELINIAIECLNLHKQYYEELLKNTKEIKN